MHEALGLTVHNGFAVTRGVPSVSTGHGHSHGTGSSLNSQSGMSAAEKHCFVL